MLYFYKLIVSYKQIGIARAEQEGCLLTESQEDGLSNNSETCKGEMYYGKRKKNHGWF